MNSMTGEGWNLHSSYIPLISLRILSNPYKIFC